MLYKVVLTFESVDKILKCDHLNKSFLAVVTFGKVYYAVQKLLSFESVVLPFKSNHFCNSHAQKYSKILQYRNPHFLKTGKKRSRILG